MDTLSDCAGRTIILMNNTLLALLSLALLIACSGNEGASGTPDQHVQDKLAGPQPNILLIVADDMGFSDISSFGGEISTPSLDALADNGLRLTRFYAAMTCSPSRAMLMSGTDNHIAGLGNMAETVADNQVGREGYEGYLSKRVLSLPELLKKSGYHTYMAGKWHLGNQYDQSPRARGFDRSFSLLYGGGGHFDDMVGPDAHRARLLYREDGELIDQLPEDFYSTQFYTDKILEYIDGQANDGKPFFGYLAYTAPHWPLQVPDTDLAKFRGKYDVGYDVYRKRRFEGMMANDLLPEGAELPPRPDNIPAWDSLSDKERQIQARDMEIYAAMVGYMDRSIGRLLDYLKKNDLYENTLIMFMSDNGAEAWSSTNGPKPLVEYARTFDNRLENRGKKGSFVLYGSGWANVGEVPFRLHKGAATEGGIRVPAIVSWPGMQSKGLINNSVTSIKDVLPTFLELAGTVHPGPTYAGMSIEVPQGQSLMPIIFGEANAIRTQEQFIGGELWGERSVIKGDWKLVYLSPRLGSGQWELFDLEKDVGEQHNLAEIEPKIFNEMLAAWNDYVVENNVILPVGPFKVRSPQPVPK